MPCPAPMWTPSIADSACSFWHTSTVCIRKAFRGGTGKTLDDCMQKNEQTKLWLKFSESLAVWSNKRMCHAGKKEKLRILEFHVITRILHRKLRKAWLDTVTQVIFTHKELKVTRVTWVSQWEMQTYTDLIQSSSFVMHGGRKNDGSRSIEGSILSSGHYCLRGRPRQNLGLRFQSGAQQKAGDGD